ncbi:AAEL003491-PB [Aedes aegypti]|uniref:AAEL003491-PB n=1 Tax=Aedes aegypti TaxID=7159 RepID=Q17F76_AEDAE|nr:AAEL003491-PB [Aedes aegypti]
MIRRIMGEVDVKLGIRQTLAKIDEAFGKRSQTIKAPKPLLVAVSKTKPIELILDGYSIGQRDFGENYVQELIEKANDPRILEHCKDIRWHFIGHLQTNKINKIVNLPNLHMIQTVHNAKLAEGLNKAWEKTKVEKPEKQQLNVLIQINTSGEDDRDGQHNRTRRQFYFRSPSEEKRSIGIFHPSHRYSLHYGNPRAADRTENGRMETHQQGVENAQLFSHTDV